MANGAAVTLEITSGCADPSINLQAEVEAGIGEAVASAATALARGLEECLEDGLKPATKAAAGERIARVYELSQEFGVGFDAVAHRAARPLLRAYLDTDFHARHGEQAVEMVIDEFIGQVLAIVGRVAAFERAMAN